MAIFKKYVDYFAGKGCKFFNFGADEYANDVYGPSDSRFSFSQLNSTQYSTFVSFINELAAYIKTKDVNGVKMTPRAFNDGLYYNNQNVTIDTDIQCCYWSSGWDTYKVVSAATIAKKGHSMINTHGDFYYVLGKTDQFDSGYSYAKNFSNKAFMRSDVNSPVGSMFCIWSDYPNAETEQVVAQKVRLPMRAMALRMNGESIDRMDTSVVANGFNADGTLNVGSTGSVTERTITVAVGGTETRTLTGTFTSDFSDNIAKVTTENIAASEKKLNPVTAIESGEQYLIVNNRKKTLLTSTPSSDWNKNYSGLKLNGSATADNTADLWTITGKNNNYTVQNTDKKYLTIGANTAAVGNGSETLTLAYTSGGYWNISQDSYYLNHLGSSTTAGGYKSSNADTDPGSQWTIYEVTGGEASTKITFKGLAVGTTSVQIGDVTYQIRVVDEDLSKVTPLTIEYWITNRQVTANGVTRKTINATDSTIYSEAGAKFTDLVPATGTQDGNDVVFWKGTRLTSDNKQTNDGGVDKTKAGDSLTYIRYWNTKWSFSADGKTWKDFNSEDQIVAYYLQKTEVTSEITTNVVDWGQPYSEWAAGKDNRWFWDGYVENGSKYVFLDFAVVYEDNTQNPSRFPSDNTLFYHFDGCSESNPRILGAISFTENSDYEIWKVTVTDGTSAGYDSYKTFTPTYDNTTETTVWDESMGGIPQIDQLQYTANRSGKLVRVYVRAKVTADSLTVNYYDESNTTLPFYSYNIAVASGTTFNNNFAYSNGSLINNTVTNIKNVTQTVNWKLEEMPEIGAQYRYSDYTFTNANKETGNKVVNLYYKFNTVKTFVVDFGLPLHIDKTDINTALASANITKVAVGKSLYATINANEDYSIDYILNKTIDGSDRVTVTYSGTNRETNEDDSATYNLTIIPASTVYYEDNFVGFSAGSAEWTRAGTTETNAVQQLDELGKTGANNYGYDDRYNSSSQFSLGSAMKTTVGSATNSNPPTATFTFKGTGFDLVSMTSKDTGTILVDVVGKDGAGNDVEKNWIVDTFYGYTRTLDGYIQYTWTKGEDDKWHNKAEEISALPAGATTGGTPVNSGDVTYELNYKWTPVTDQSNALYQIPVIHYTDLPYGTYTVTITPKYSSARDPYYTAGGDNSYDFYLDGVRIYNPAGDTLNDQYVKDHEGYAQFTEIRDMLLSASSLKADIDPTTTGMVFVDGVGDHGTLTDYTNYGPNNEVYLSKGQAIAFKISDMSNVDTIQIGAKAPSGNTTMQIKVNGNDVQTQELTTASDMYYKLDSVTANETVVITNTGDNLLSLTTLKVTYKTAPTAMNSAEAIVDSDVLAQAPVMLTSMLYGEPQTFEPSRFEARWGRSVRAGQKATLTVKASDDVGAIEVNGVTIDTYRTHTERTGWGWWAKRVTYREFTYTMTAEATADYAVYALNSDGVKSEPTTATLTVKPAINWWHKWF